MTFSCNECNRTFPDRDNQIEEEKPDGMFTATSADGICPDCYDEDEHGTEKATAKSSAGDDDDDDDHAWRGGYFRGPTNG